MKERIYFIYKYTFPNGKIYIGQTYKGSRRFGKVSDYIGTLVYRAMKKYPNYKKEIIEYCDESTVDSREKFWIAFYNSSHRDYGYNRDSGGNTNKRLSEDLKHQLSLSHQGMYAKPVLQFDLRGNLIKEWISEKEVERALGIQINPCCTGRQKTAGGFQWKLKEDTRVIEDIYDPIEQYDLDGNFIQEWDCVAIAQKKLKVFGISKACKNNQPFAGGFLWKYVGDDRIIEPYVKPSWKMSDEAKAKLSLSKKGKPSKRKGLPGMKGTKNPRATPILQYDLDGTFIREWEYISLAAKACNVAPSTITGVLKGYQKTAGGFKWKYKK